MNKAEVIRVASASGEATACIQAAIDKAGKGPLRVVLEPGIFPCGGLRLRSDVELHISDGAELHFISDYDAYAGTGVDIVAENSDRGMIVAQDCERVAVTGKGRIVCDSAPFVIGEDPGMDIHTPADRRPRVLVIERCRQVTLRDVSVSDSPMWTLHFVDSDEVTIDGIRVDNNKSMPNTDGLVIDGCRNVTVTNCRIHTADDGIVLKTSIGPDGKPTGACRNVRVTHCEVESQSCALKIGTESHADFEDISFSDCTIIQSNRGLGIFSRDGGAVRRVAFSRITIDCREAPPGFWGSGEGICINVLDRRPHLRPAGSVTDIRIEDVSGHMQGAINLIAERPAGISGVVMRSVVLSQTPGPHGAALAYDLRPTPADLEPTEEGVGRQNSWRLGPDGRIIGCIDYPGGMPGLYAHNTSDLVLEDVTITRPDTLPEGFNTEIVVRD